MRRHPLPRRVLGIFPHPDDEAYAAGGLLAHCVTAGAVVDLLCATRGENGVDREAATQAGPQLAARRTRELEASCAALGVAAPVFLDLPDGRLSGDDAVAVARIAQHIERLRPHLMVTLGRDGVYASLDHLACSAIASAALSRADRPIRLLHAVFPRRLFAPIWRALRRRPGTPLVADVDPQMLGVDEPELRLDIRAVRDRKLAAIAAHRSQLVGGDPFTLLRPGLLERLLDEEWYVVAHGPALPAGARDPFAGL